MLLAWLTWIYLALLLGYILWTTLDWPRPWWLKVLNTIAFWVFAPSLLLLLLAIFVRSAGFRLAASLVALAFIGDFWLPALPWGLLRRWMYPRRRAPGQSQPLRLMSANLLKSNGHVAGIIDRIVAVDADVVALQELKPEHAAAIRTQLSEAYPYQQLCPGRESEGMGLLSRAPFLSYDLQAGPPGANPTQVASLLLRGRETWIINVHARIPELQRRPLGRLMIPYNLDTTGREADIRALRSLAGHLPGHLLILGDLNLTDQCYEYRLLPRRWRDAQRDVGWGPGWTFPVGTRFFGVRLPFPIFRIDYVFCRGTWEPRSIRSERMSGSDHHCLIAEFD